MEKEKVIALLVEDIKHNQLLNGLDSIGLWDHDRYTLELDILIADLMGYKHGMIPDSWLDVYHKTMLSIPNNLTPKEAKTRAVILYNDLLQVQP
jgi:hypothetical protein